MRKPHNYATQAVLAGILFFSSVVTYAVEHVIDQKNKKFSDTSITIKKGDTVVFTNSDPMPHNIHSLSEVDLFDLGTYRQGAERKHTFKNVGLHEIECVIHPFMFLTIKVK